MHAPYLCPERSSVVLLNVKVTFGLIRWLSLHGRQGKRKAADQTNKLVNHRTHDLRRGLTGLHLQYQ